MIVIFDIVKAYEKHLLNHIKPPGLMVIVIYVTLW